MSRWRWIWLGAFSALAGCGGASGPGKAGPAKGATLLEVTNQVGGPCQVVGLVIGAGSETVQLRPAPPPSATAVPVGELQLAPGDHVVGARVSARCAGGAGIETVVVGTQQILRLEPRPRSNPAVMITLASRAGEGSGRIAVALAVRGGVLVPERGVADRDQICAGVRATRKALCRAEADLALATARKDVAWALCVRDLLGELRAASDLYDDVQARADQEGEELAQARLHELAARVERCAAGMVPESASSLVVHPR
jgi:hypothetical protein